MRRIITIILTLISISVYGQQNNTTYTKFPNGFAVGDGATNKPTTSPSTGSMWYKTGTGLQVWDGTQWVTLNTGSLGNYVLKAGDNMTGGLGINTASNESALISVNNTASVASIDVRNLGAGLIQTWKASAGTVVGSMPQTGLLTTLGGFSKTGSDDTYVLLGGGGTALLSSLTPTNYWTTNSSQTGLTGGKETSGSLRILGTGNGIMFEVRNVGTSQTTFKVDNMANSGSGRIQEWLNNNAILSWVERSGNINSPAFVTTGGTASQVVLGDGTLGTYSGGSTLNSLTNGYGVNTFSFNGSSAQTVVADTTSATGLVSKSRLASNLTGYLPLTAGSGKSLTGTLYNTQNAATTVVPTAGMNLQNTTIGAGSFSPPINMFGTFTGGITKGIRMYTRASGVQPTLLVDYSVDGTTFLPLLTVGIGSTLSFYNTSGFGATFSSNNITATRAYGLPDYSATLATNPMTTVGDIMYAGSVSGSSTVISRLAGVATGNALISGGTSTAPSWGKIGLTTHVSGVLPIANGGTNSATQNWVDLTNSQANIAGLKTFTTGVAGQYGDFRSLTGTTIAIGLVFGQDYNIPSNPKSLIQSYGQSTIRGGIEFRQLNGSGGDLITPFYIDPSGLSTFYFGMNATSINASSTVTIARAGNEGLIIRNATANNRFQFYVGDGSGGTTVDENYIINNNTDLNILNSGGGVQLVNGATSWSAISDMRLKTKVSDMPSVLDGISLNHPFIGYYNSNTKKSKGYMLSAQELKSTFPHVVDVGTDSDKTLSVRYSELIPVLFKAIQELKEEIELLKIK